MPGASEIPVVDDIFDGLGDKDAEMEDQLPWKEDVQPAEQHNTVQESEEEEEDVPAEFQLLSKKLSKQTKDIKIS